MSIDSSALFQSTRPCGARRAVSRCCSSINKRFNPRARAGRDTSRPRKAQAITTCFNPRAREGRDVVIRVGEVRARWFQSTRPCGARRTSSIAYRVPFNVSIHAPVRGATGDDRPILRKMQRCFNPRARTGRDVMRVVNGCCWDSCFNPRARTGRDVLPWGDVSVSRLFQSTRPYGARRSVPATLP